MMAPNLLTAERAEPEAASAVAHLPRSAAPPVDARTLAAHALLMLVVSSIAAALVVTLA